MAFWVKRSKNNRYILGLLISLLLVTIHIIFDMFSCINKLDGKSWDFLPATMWIGTTINGNANYLFYALLPLFSVLGLNIICYEDCKTSFIKRYVQYRGIKNYCMATFILSFMSGFIIVGMPLLVDLLMAFCLFPNINPDNLVNINLGITHRSMYFNQLYFTHPVTFILTYIFGTACLAGVYSCAAATISLYLKTLYSALATIFLGVIGISLISILFHGSIPMLLTLPNAIASNPVLPPLIVLIIIWLLVLLVSFILFIRGVQKNVTI